MRICTQSLSLAVILVCTSFLLAQGADLDLNSQLSVSRCGKEILSVLQSWGVEQHWTKQVNAWDESRSFISPTNQLGVWVELKWSDDEPTELDRISAESVEKLTWNAQCASHSEKKYQKKAQKSGSGFTDEDLLLTLRKYPAGGAFYLWSPHMPCSVKGLKEAENAAKTLGVKVVALMDPTSNRKFANATAKREGFSPDALKEVDSLELIFRGLTVHAPSFLLFSGGEIRGEVLRGYRIATDYERFLMAHLKGEAK